MAFDNVIGDVISIIASVTAFCYVLGIWRMVHAPSRLVLLMAMLYMVVTRVAILSTKAATGDSWIIEHRSLIIVPQYVLFAIAFGMTYYELRHFHFEVPKNSEDLDTQEKHVLEMDALRKSTTATEWTETGYAPRPPKDSEEKNL